MTGLDFSTVIAAWPFLWQGLQFSLSLTMAAFAIGMTFGTTLALVQQVEAPILSQLARLYVMIMRSVPLIMVLFWFFFLVPVLAGYITGSGRPIPIGATTTAYVTFGLFEAAYYCEIIRSGLRGVPRGQYEAAKSLALGTIRTYWLIIMPQVVRTVSPIIFSQTIILFQDTSLVYVLSLTDLLGAASKMGQINGRLVEMYLAAAAIYFALSWVGSHAVAVLRQRFGH